MRKTNYRETTKFRKWSRTHRKNELFHTVISEGGSEKPHE
ncbi:hypothetical protein J2W48_001033 [Flavobacterium piscis]|uniref:ENTH domain-containing protein n=1 Tax=Flavobacterium piscis TaxID=1114874 RepID=A0ABU1Y4W6_9FLAO|nr:hypothetical protein [Flavobacterium piscis]